MQRHLEDGSTSSHTASGASVEIDSGYADYISFGVVPLAMALGILTRTTLARWVPIPYTVLLLLWGLVFGSIYTEMEDPFNPALNNGIRAWISMDPRVLQVLFLPILIFASAFNAQFHILERRLGQILFLAAPGVIMGTCLTACFIKYVLPYDWDWNLCLVFGSMVAATDPVAVVALLEELGVSEKLGTLIEGESLFNDGSAIVVFEVFLEAVEGTTRNWHQILGFGARLALGGPAIGAALGLVGAFILGYIVNDALVEVSLTVILAFSTFALCESTSIKVSGVLGIVACGVMLSYYGKPRVSSTVLPSLMDFWKTLQFFADTTIFFLSGLIVIGVAVSSERAITGADYGYLLALFVALYVIRGLVVLAAYPVLRSGEYKITVPQMVVLTHSGLRGAVALILALVVDGVHEIDQENRDKIVFLTAGVAVLSLVFNGTTTGPLVRFLKLDRATEASESVFENACFALELSMEKQEQNLKEDEFLGNADWTLVWRYLPVLTAECYWHRLAKGHVALSRDEVEDIHDVNSRASQITPPRGGIFSAFERWVRNKKGGFGYTCVPHRLRRPWFAYHTKFLFRNSGGEELWGDLDSFLANHAAGDDSAEAWAGHLKHSDNLSKATGATGGSGGGGGGGLDEQKSDAGVYSSGKLTTSSAGRAGGVTESQKAATNKNTGKDAGVPTGGLDSGDSDGDSKKSKTDSRAESMRTSLANSATHGGKHIKVMFKRAANMARDAGTGIDLTEKNESPGEIDQSELVEARLRFLAALKAEYHKAKREGKLGSSGLRVLTEGINNAHDKVDRGCELEGWSELSGRFSQGWQIDAARYMNWWPARPVAAATIARRVSFQMELAWNFLEAHHEGNLKGLLADNGQVSKVQRQINLENQKQIDAVDDMIEGLTIRAPMVTRGVKTQTAARVMMQRYREAVELLAENGHLGEKEEEVLLHAVTEGEMRLAYHPNLEALPELSRVLEKIEFLNELTSDEMQRLMDVEACYYHEYVGEVRLIKMGQMGAKGTKKSDSDRKFSGWFYLVRGQVEKQWKTESGHFGSDTYSSGLLFGITDPMLGIPHHAGYMTHGFSNLIVFDQHKLLEEAETMPSLDKSLWKSTASHSLRRSIRFHKFKLQSCRSLLDRAEFLTGGSGEGGEVQTIEIATDDAVILVRGKIVEVQGKVSRSALGQADTSEAPVLLEPMGSGGGGGSVVVSGDCKAFKMPSGMLMIFEREEKVRMKRQETLKRGTLSISSLTDGLGLEMDIDVGPSEAPKHRGILGGSHSVASAHGDEVEGLAGVMERQMTARFENRLRSSKPAMKAAMKLLAGLKSSREEAREGGDGESGGSDTHRDASSDD